MKAARIPAAETTCGLLVLLGLVTALVLATAPKPKTPEEQQKLLLGHQGIRYFIEGEALAKAYVSDPSLRWSQPVLNPRTGCTYVGRDVWCAFGTISGPPDKMPAPSPWALFFVPETSELLFLRVGDRALGDGPAALARAGVKAPSLPGGTHAP